MGPLVSPVSFAPAALLAAVLAPAPQGRGQQPFTVSVNVDLVVLNVSVTDSRGRHSLVTFNERVSLGLPSSMPFTSDPDRIRSVAPTAGRDLRVTTRDGYRAASARGAP